MIALRWGIVPAGGRWLVGYARGSEFIPHTDCISLEAALAALATLEGQP